VVHLEIIGYADDIGADAYNLSLSERRASVVAVYLLERNVKVDQVHIEGRGPVREQGPKAKNRRVDIRITFKE
jgi:outer membrane protein OmpA-like peptidoglycan-associated protein